MHYTFRVGLIPREVQVSRDLEYGFAVLNPRLRGRSNRADGAFRIILLNRCRENLFGLAV